jgi:hypothetical protein
MLMMAPLPSGPEWLECVKAVVLAAGSAVLSVPRVVMDEALQRAKQYTVDVAKDTVKGWFVRNRKNVTGNQSEQWTERVEVCEVTEVTLDNVRRITRVRHTKTGKTTRRRQRPRR